jgi:hypothetical protein
MVRSVAGVSLALVASLVGLLAVVAVPTIASAQSTQFGIPPFSSTAGGADAINLSNLNVEYTAPVHNRTGSSPFSISQTFEDLNPARELRRGKPKTST